MIYIQKKSEPPELTQYKKQKFAHYEGMPKMTKEAVKQSLLTEQGYLCAYCMRRIGIESMTIEHYLCQSEIPEAEGLEYKIMLGVCLVSFSELFDAAFVRLFKGSFGSR